MTRLSRIGLATLGLVALAHVSGPGSVQAQTTAASDKIAGAWEGSFTTDGPSGTMSLTVTKGSPWKVAVGLAGDVPPPGEPTDVVVSGNVLSWKQVYGDFDVAFKATLSDDGTKLTGTLEATQGGSYVGGGSFSLTRKG